MRLRMREFLRENYASNAFREKSLGVPTDGQHLATGAKRAYPLNVRH